MGVIEIEHGIVRTGILERYSRVKILWPDTMEPNRDYFYGLIMATSQPLPTSVWRFEIKRLGNECILQYFLFSSRINGRLPERRQLI